LWDFPLIYEWGNSHILWDIPIDVIFTHSPLTVCTFIYSFAHAYIGNTQ
jgi:hypothetical protein